MISHKLLEEIRIIKNVTKHVRSNGLDAVEYYKDQVVKVPLNQAYALIRKGYAANGKCARTQPCFFAHDGSCSGCICDLSIFPRSYPWVRKDHDLFEYVE